MRAGLCRNSPVDQYQESSKQCFATQTVASFNVTGMHAVDRHQGQTICRCASGKWLVIETFQSRPEQRARRAVAGRVAIRSWEQLRTTASVIGRAYTVAILIIPDPCACAAAAGRCRRGAHRRPSDGTDGTTDERTAAGMPVRDGSTHGCATDAADNCSASGAIARIVARAGCDGDRHTGRRKYSKQISHDRYPWLQQCKNCAAGGSFRFRICEVTRPECQGWFLIEESKQIGASFPGRRVFPGRNTWMCKSRQHSIG